MNHVQPYDNLISNIKYYSTRKEKYQHTKWNTIPVIDKGIVRDNYSDFLKLSSAADLIVNRTSGSTNDILEIPWEKVDYYISLSKTWKLRAKYGITPLSLCATNHSHSYNGNFVPILHDVIEKKSTISFSKLHFSPEKMLKYLKILADRSVDWIFMQPSFVFELAVTYRKFNIKIPSIKLIELIGEMLPDNVKTFISETFQVPVVNHYGMQEFNSIAYEDQEGLRVLTDNVFVEILDDEDQPCDYGVDGNIVVTTLTNHHMPLIRYKTMDRGSLRRSKNGNLYLKLTNARKIGVLNINGELFDQSLFFALTEKLNAHGNQIFRFQYIIDADVLNCYFLAYNQLDLAYVKSLVEKNLSERFGIFFSRINIIESEPPIKHDGEKYQYFIDANQQKKGVTQI